MRESKQSSLESTEDLDEKDYIQSREVPWSGNIAKGSREAPSRWNTRPGFPKMPTMSQFQGLFSAILFYADLLTDWLVAGKLFKKGGGGSNCWIPIVIVIFLLLTGAASMMAISEYENNDNFEPYSKRN